VEEASIAKPVKQASAKPKAKRLPDLMLYDSLFDATI